MRTTSGGRRAAALLSGLALLAGCTTTSPGVAGGPVPTSAAAGFSGPAQPSLALPSSFPLVTLPAPGSTPTTGPAAPSARSSSTPATSSSAPATSSSAPVTSRSAPATSSRAPVTTVGSTRTSRPSPSPYACPAPAAVGQQEGNLPTAVQCYDGNRWLVLSGVFPTGEPVDGVAIVQQTRPGVFRLVGAGSDFSGNGAGLQAQGVPADLAGHLADGTPLAHETRYDHPLADFFAVWGRHTSALTLRANRTGSMLLGSGCCNSITLPLAVTPDYTGVLTATVSGPATYTGTDFASVTVTVGTPVYFHFEKGSAGPVLVSSDPTGQNGGPIVWCGATGDDRCGA